MADPSTGKKNAAGSGFYGYAYETSAVFANMKRVDEQIKKNWSTEQYLNALDMIIAHTVEPIIRSSNFLDHMIAGIMAWHADTANHKITAHDKLDAIQYFMTFLTRKDPEEKLLIFRRIKFDRNITLLMVDAWLDQLEGYKDCCERIVTEPTHNGQTTILLEQHHLNVMHGPQHSSLYAAIQSVTYWRGQGLKLRTQIAEKYYRMILNEAKSFYEQMNHSISLDDTIQAMYLEASKALDKCNQERGTITSYMQRYLRFSRPNIKTEMDTAYTVKGNARNGDYSYKSQSLDEVSDSLEVSSDNTDQVISVMHVRKLARLLDPLGIGRHSLGIEEYLPALVQDLGDIRSQELAVVQKAKSTGR